MNEELKFLIDNHKYISFDVFNTLVVRPFVTLNDQFAFIERVTGCNGFSEARSRVRVELFNQLQREEVTYEEMRNFLGDKYFRCCELEEELEMRWCSKDTNMSEAYEYVKKNGKIIILTTDMYFNREIISKILEVNGYDSYDYLFISSEQKLRKHTGNLYIEIVHRLGIDYSQLLHIGDNEHADKLVPQKLGIATYLYRPNIERFLNENPCRIRLLQSTKHGHKGLDVSILFGLLSIKYNDNCDKNYWYEFGYNYSGPLMYSFVQWFYNYITKESSKDIVFIARDGFSLLKVFELFDKNNLFEKKYLYLTRNVASLGLLTCEDDIRELFSTSMYSKEYIKHAINTFSEINEEIKSIFGKASCSLYDSKEKVLQEMLSQKDLFFIASKEYREIIYDYLIKNNLLKRDIVLIDSISGSARAQRVLQLIKEEKNLDIDIFGYYFYHEKYYEDLYQRAFGGFDGNYRKNQSKKWHLIELMMTAPELPIIGILKNKNGYSPIYQTSNIYEEKRIQIFKGILDGIVDFVRMTKSLFNDYTIWTTPDKIIEHLNCFIDTVCKSGSKHFSKVFYTSNHVEYLPFFGKIDVLEDNRTNCNNLSESITSVIVTRNKKEYLQRCIRSVTNQTLKVGTIIIVDNGSTDGTKEFMEFFSREELVYIRLDENMGGAGGFYAGLKKAVEMNSEWISLMDDDCELDKNCYEMMFSQQRNKENVYFPLRIDDKDRKTMTSFFPFRERQYKSVNMNKEYETDHASFNGFTIHRELVEKIGNIDKDYFIYQDDVEYSKRVKLNGGKLVLVTKAIVYHPWRKGYQEISNPLRAYYENRNIILHSKKYSNKPHFLPFFEKTVLGATKSILNFNSFKAANLYIQSFIDGLNNRKYVRKDVLKDEGRQLSAIIISDHYDREVEDTVRRIIKSEDVFLNIYVVVNRIDDSGKEKIDEMNETSSKFKITYINLNTILKLVNDLLNKKGPSNSEIERIINDRWYRFGQYSLKRKIWVIGKVVSKKIHIYHILKPFAELLKKFIIKNQ